MYSSDSEDAFQIVLIIADLEEDPSDSMYKKIRSNWERALSASKEETIDLLTAQRVRRSHHGRRVPSKYLKNPVLLGRTKNNELITLDGNHRLSQHIENNNESIPAFIIDLSWLEDADDMEYYFP